MLPNIEHDIAENYDGVLLEIMKTNLIISINDNKGRLIYANDNFCKILGYNLEDILGEPISLIESDRHSDPFFKDLWNTIKEGRIWKGILCKGSCDGKSICLETTIKPVQNIDGEIRKFVAMYVEITNDSSIQENSRKTD